MELVEITLLVLLGSAIAYLLDTVFVLTPRLGAWIAARLDPR